jgi:hypothetical protein
VARTPEASEKRTFCFKKSVLFVEILIGINPAETDR